MLKYICAFFIAFALIACEPREGEGPPSPAQQPEPEMPAETQQPDQTQEAEPTAQFSEDELDVYVDANAEAREEQIDPIMNRDEMEEILEDKEIDYNRFNEIHTAIQQDPQLQQEVEQRIEEELGEGMEEPQGEF